MLGIGSVDIAGKAPPTGEIELRPRTCDRARNEVRGTIMCASVFPFSHKNIEGVFVGTVVPLLCRNMS